MDSEIVIGLFPLVLTLPVFGHFGLMILRGMFALTVH